MGVTIVPADHVAIQSPAIMRLEVDTTLYPAEAVFKASYKFTDRSYLSITRRDDTTLLVEFQQQQVKDNLTDIVGAFRNELIDQRLRIDLIRETRVTRDLIIKQVFIEADLSGVPDSHSD